VEKRCDGGVGVTKLIGPVESRWFEKLEGISKYFRIVDDLAMTPAHIGRA
jgi:hypothetical protein